MNLPKPRRLVGTRIIAVALAAAVATALVPAAASSAGPGANDTKKPQRHRVDVAGETKAVDSPEPGTIEDRGTITGKPFGKGTIRLLVTFEGASATGTFKLRTDKGTAFGTVDMVFTISGNEITFDGTADFTGGKGKFKGIKGENLEAYDNNTLDGQNGTIELEGFATY
jgi:hypothetical protein